MGSYFDKDDLDWAKTFEATANKSLESLRQHLSSRNLSSCATFIFAETMRNKDGDRQYHLGRITLDAMWVYVNRAINIRTIEAPILFRQPRDSVSYNERETSIVVKTDHPITFEPILGMNAVYDYLYGLESPVTYKIIADMDDLVTSSTHELI